MYIYFLSFHYSTPLTKHTRRKTYIFSFFFFLLLFYPPSLQSSLMKVSFCPNNNNNIFYFLWGLNQNGLLSSPTSCVSLTWRYTFCSPHFFWVKQIQANGLHSLWMVFRHYLCVSVSSHAPSIVAQELGNSFVYINMGEVDP